MIGLPAFGCAASSAGISKADKQKGRILPDGTMAGMSLAHTHGHTCLRRYIQYTLEELQHSWMARIGGDEAIFISATRKDNIDALRTLMYERVKAIHVARYPYEQDLLFRDWTVE